MYLAGLKLAQKPVCRMDTRETPATKAADAEAPWTELREICALVILKTFLTQEEIILIHVAMCSLLLPKNRKDTQDPPDLPKRLHTA